MSNHSNPTRRQLILAILRSRLTMMVLCGGTIARGVVLLLPEEYVSAIETFPQPWLFILGLSMLVFPIGKIFALFSRNPKIKKYFLMGILLSWTALFWGYLNSPTPNTGYISAGTMMLLCYVELYRGEGTSHGKP